eukprot:TRINITY_DN7108_c0_g1_i1.p1 TRINITY_DN7108_c0_g1~~TRINITY_DN7108_c0_g1_i1.p1  ORF type:complete len:459 (-),score=100.74 TRINITY_DN7108_c0_g1_i1:39-1415(-)
MGGFGRAVLLLFGVLWLSCHSQTIQITSFSSSGNSSLFTFTASGLATVLASQVGQTFLSNIEVTDSGTGVLVTASDNTPMTFQSANTTFTTQWTATPSGVVVRGPLSITASLTDPNNNNQILASSASTCSPLTLTTGGTSGDTLQVVSAAQTVASTAGRTNFTVAVQYSASATARTLFIELQDAVYGLIASSNKSLPTASSGIVTVSLIATQTNANLVRNGSYHVSLVSTALLNSYGSLVALIYPTATVIQTAPSGLLLPSCPVLNGNFSANGIQIASTASTTRGNITSTLVSSTFVATNTAANNSVVIQAVDANSNNVISEVSMDVGTNSSGTNSQNISFSSTASNSIYFSAILIPTSQVGSGQAGQAQSSTGVYNGTSLANLIKALAALGIAAIVGIIVAVCLCVGCVACVCLRRRQGVRVQEVYIGMNTAAPPPASTNQPPPPASTNQPPPYGAY